MGILSRKKDRPDPQAAPEAAPEPEEAAVAVEEVEATGSDEVAAPAEPAETESVEEELARGRRSASRARRAPEGA